MPGEIVSGPCWLSGKIPGMSEMNSSASGTEVVVALCTAPDPETAESLAGGLVENRLAACVNILPEIRSIYRWDNEVQRDSEVLIVIKTTRPGVDPLKRWLAEHHPYDVPELLALPVTDGLSDYLGWVIQETR